MFEDPCWPGEGQLGEMSSTSLALPEPGRWKALKAEKVLKGQSVTDSWAAIKKTKYLQMADRVMCIYTHTQADSFLSLSPQAREDAAVNSALDGLDQKPFPPHNLLNKLGAATLVFSCSHNG